MAFAEQERSVLVRDAAAEVARPGTAPLPLGATVAAVSSVDAFLGLEPDWRRLETRAAASSVFQTFDWLAAWASTYGRQPDHPGIFIVTGRQNGQLAFALPLMKSTVGPITILRWMSEPLSQYGDALLAKDQNPEPWLAGALRLIRAESGVDALRLRHVRDDAAAAPFLRRQFRDAHMNEQAPWLDLTAFADESAYDARYTSNQRKRRKKIRKALEDDFGPVIFEMLEAGPAQDEAIAGAVAEKCVWLDDRGRHNRALCVVQTVAFLRNLSRRSSGHLQMVVSRMSAGGRPVSWEVGLRCGRTHFGFITSHVTALTDYSPGRLHMDQSQRRALKDGMAAFDLMVPNDAHKESWSSARMETRDYHLPLTNLGRLYGIGYLETARPLLRKAYYRMPPQLLKLLKPVTGH